MKNYWKTKGWRNKILICLWQQPGYDEKPDNGKSSLLLHHIGERARKVYNTFNFSTTADSMKIEHILEQFKACFNQIYYQFECF